REPRRTLRLGERQPGTRALELRLRLQDGPTAAREKWQRKRYPHDRQQPGIGRVAPVEAADEAEGAPHAASLQRRRQLRRVERLLSGGHLERRRHGNVAIAVDISRDREGIR